MRSASLCISSLKYRIVTLAVFMAMGIALSGGARAEEEPEIEAKAYDIKTVRPSKSGRVYLFEKSESDLPVDGKLFLVRQGETSVMAMRVLKTYSDKNRIAAKKLRTYPGFEKLEPGSSFRAFEKIGDKVLPVPPTAEDMNDLKELENSESTVPVEEAKPELPEEPPMSEAAPEPAPEPTPESAPEVTPPPISEPADATAYEETEEISSAEVSEPEDDMDRYFPNGFTLAIGDVPNNNVPGPTLKFSGGMLYARNLVPTLAAEVGLFYYKAAGTANDTDVSMTVVPFIGTLRLQKKYGTLWTGYAYGGFVYPLIPSQIGATNAILRQIQVISPAIGVGAFLQTGPNWYMRFNLGLDSITLGVMLRY